jgi:hypothetical protein
MTWDWNQLLSWQYDGQQTAVSGFAQLAYFLLRPYSLENARGLGLQITHGPKIRQHV